jgi:hypothetical protein
MRRGQRLRVSRSEPLTYEAANCAFLFAFFPIVYFVFGHLGVALGCVVYNFLFKYIGGFEFEAKVE